MFYLNTYLLIVFIGPKRPTIEGHEADAADEPRDASGTLLA